MLGIDWDEILAFWNNTFGTDFFYHGEMLEMAYQEFPSLHELSSKLGVAPETLRQKMRKEKVRLRPPGGNYIFRSSTTGKFIKRR